jgi:hypothetical protein
MFKRGKSDKIRADNLRHVFFDNMVGAAEKNPKKFVTFHILRRS